MIITKLTANNFFRFFGSYSFEFAHGKDKNVTVVRGDNGTGKTTLLNAFYWCLYGDVMEPLVIEKLLNELAEHKIAVGDTDDVFVEIFIEDKGHEYIIKRQRSYKNRDNTVVPFGDEEFNISQMDGNGNPIPVKDKQNFFDNFIPKNLRGFFFFDGERINRLAQVDGRDEIKKAILDILGLTKLERLKEFFENLKKDYNKELKQNSDREQQHLTEEYETLIAQRDKMQDKIDQFKDNLRIANQNLAETERYLETHNSENVKTQQKLRKSLEDSATALGKQIIEKTKIKNALVTKSFKNNLIVECFNYSYEYLESKRQRGELPSDIKVQFIDDLLHDHTCICGRCLDEGSTEYKAVEAKKAYAGCNELDDAYHRLTAYIKAQQGETATFFKRYHDINGEIFDLTSEKESNEKQAKEIGAALRKSDEEEIAQREALRDQLKNDILEYTLTIRQTENELADKENQIAQKEKQIKQAEFKGGQAEVIKKRLDLAFQLADMNEKIRTYFIEITRANLDSRIRDVFNTMKEKEYRFARLTSNFILEITNDLEDAEDNRILSTGEGQVASLSFIGSLVSYAREKMQDELMSDFSGGDFPIVMDSPFGNLTKGHKGNVAREIGNLASQVIVIVSDEQWSSVVEDNISPRVGAFYRMEDGSDEKQSVGEHTVVRRVK